ncbi:hypothetical protein ACHHYP_07446 [Achlya hypogyna]|uniref:Uncharacterized protein n=1 Tax=Achlya hypogyna TaxID=1202772 RepID=A0A1V9ZM00_ACHHY|nr:hypothetical protein ACHHYP_07446 [Achlya hypogyna]
MAKFMGLSFILNTKDMHERAAKEDILRTSNLLVNLNLPHPVLPSLQAMSQAPLLLRPTLADAINTATVRRRLAIERRNAKRNIPSKASSVSPPNEPLLIHVKNTKNRVSAAAYREKRDKKLSVILAEIARLEQAHPDMAHRPFVPAKKVKSEQLPTESKEEYRRRTNRESAAGSRQLQQEKLRHYTRELARLRNSQP